MRDNNMVLQWIPAHFGTRGSGTADMLAQAGSHLPQPHDSTSYQEAETLLKQKFKIDRRNRTMATASGTTGANQNFRLRIGHSGLKRASGKDGARRRSTVRVWPRRTDSWAHCSSLTPLRRKAWRGLDTRHSTSHRALRVRRRH